MADIQILAKELVDSLEAKRAEEINTAAEQIVEHVKTVTIKEVITEQLDVDITGLATKDEVSAVEDKIPSLEGLASETFVNNAISTKADAESVYDKSEVDTALSLKMNIGDANDALALKANKAELPDFDTFATKTEVSDVVDTLATKEEVADDLATKANVSDLEDLATKQEVTDAIAAIEIPDITPLATKESVNSALSQKADITDLFALATKAELQQSIYDDTEIRNTLATKADADSVYSKDETISLLEAKANLADVYAKVDTYSAEKIQELLDLEANKDEVYTISQVDDLLAAKASASDIPDVSNFLTANDIVDKADVADVESALALKADKTEIPDVSVFLTAEDVADLATKTEVAAKADTTDLESLAADIEAVDAKIPSIEGLATETYVDNSVSIKADKADLFKNGVFNAGWTAADGSTHYFSAEAGDFGGIFSFNKPQNTKIFFGHNKSTSSDDVDAQLYAIDPDTREGARLQISKEKGIFYLPAGTTNLGMPPANELAVKGDIPDVSNFLVAADIAGKADAADVNDALALKADKTEIPDISGKADSSSVYTKAEVDQLVADAIAAATANMYTKAEVDAAIQDAIADTLEQINTEINANNEPDPNEP